MKWKQPFVLVTGIIALSIIVGLSISFFFQTDKTEREEDFLQELSAETTGETTDKEESVEENKVVQHVVVDVKGEVNSPGVYDIKEGERVIDAIDLAGGLLEDADPVQVNFAERVYDEMIIYVPKQGTESEINPNNSEQNDKVRINYADREELETLPGVGPAKAEAIISYREEHGLFQSEEDLQSVSGIGEKSLEQLNEFITAD
ncbi:competence protein ComEA [Salibacterium salarium]|uniref:helix-hairpin-helix domain-containing protein n=1 Tax=Salibacterium salarium TaxID=284579 RepID=UPI0027846303|nr:helix-hairpin-helix domain-containing protein [Salibacterium salarium]MDQ0299775.1 competence protein ComEA [Salibacterium salarium]